MSILMRNLHTLWSLILSLYNPCVIGFFSLLFGCFILAAAVELAREKYELSRDSILRFWLLMGLPLALNGSLWFFYQFAKLEMEVNITVSFLLLLPSLTVTSFYWERSSEISDEKQ